MSLNVPERIASRRYSFPENLTKQIERQLGLLGYSLSKPGELAKAIKRLSDFYLTQPLARTPWNEKWAQAAYLAYFFPLNYSRSWSVVDEGLRVGFFEGLEGFVDFGSGLSAYGFLLDGLRGQFIDIAPEALKLHETLVRAAGSDQSKTFDDNEKSTMHDSDLSKRHEDLVPSARPNSNASMNLVETARTWSKNYRPFENRNTSLGIFSYVFTELKSLPSWAYDLEALLIVEPSTREDGRRLHSLRKELLNKGFFAWAPCTHQEACPLLEKSKTDWCHDRIFFEAPEWFAGLEKLLPMKNRTITFSYLLVRKSRPHAKPSGNIVGRLTGDRLAENGKTKQLFCRGPEREFVSWLHKFGEPPHLLRGQITKIPQDFEKKGDELRTLPNKINIERK